MIYCHHHSKGAQGGKNAADRASGSGVFARDADALLDMIQLKVPESMQSYCGVSESATAWRIEPVLREFPEPGPVDVWFDYPRHFVDRDGNLATCKPDDGIPTVEELNKRRQAAQGEKVEALMREFERLEKLSQNGVVQVQDLVFSTGMTPATIIKHLESAGFTVKGDKFNRYTKDKKMKESNAFVFRA